MTSPESFPASPFTPERESHVITRSLTFPLRESGQVALMIDSLIASGFTGEVSVHIGQGGICAVHSEETLPLVTR